MNEDELAASARQLATGIGPERDLWAGIEAAITQPEEQRSRWTPMLAQVAAVILLVGASSGLTYLAVKDEPTVVVAQPAPDYYVMPAAFGSNHNLSSDYLDARAGLYRDFEVELERLSPGEREDIVTSLDVIRGAIDDINAALEEDPDNVLLQDLLLNTYREELNVLQQVGGATQSVMSRSDI